MFDEGIGLSGVFDEGFGISCVVEGLGISCVVVGLGADGLGEGLSGLGDGGWLGEDTDTTGGLSLTVVVEVG